MGMDDYAFWLSLFSGFLARLSQPLIQRLKLRFFAALKTLAYPFIHPHVLIAAISGHANSDRLFGEQSGRKTHSNDGVDQECFHFRNRNLYRLESINVTTLSISFWMFVSARSTAL